MKANSFDDAGFFQIGVIGIADAFLASASNEQ